MLDTLSNRELMVNLLKENIRLLIKAGYKIQAIKNYRAIFHANGETPPLLIECKNYVDRLADEMKREEDHGQDRF